MSFSFLKIVIFYKSKINGRSCAASTSQRSAELSFGLVAVNILEQAYAFTKTVAYGNPAQVY